MTKISKESKICKSRPKKPFILQSQQLYVQIIDYYRCLDTFNDNIDEDKDENENSDSTRNSKD